MQTIKVNIIKPPKIKAAEFNRAITEMLVETDKGILKDFSDTTGTWKHEVGFKHGHSLTSTQGRAYTSTADEIYHYVNDGTPAHRIPKAGNARLAFRWGGKGSYKPKTQPGRFGSKPGGPTGPVVHKAWVWHPGTSARKFDELIAKRWRTLLPRALRNALGKGAKASGHGIP
jgi:hypothetical protein